MSTSLLDKLIAQRRDRNEQSRQLTLQKVQTWLTQNHIEFGIQQAYIFGSLCRPGHFHENSDVDIAVGQVKRDRYFEAISLLSAWVERDVDLIELDKCPFQHRIRETGIPWTAPTD